MLVFFCCVAKLASATLRVAGIEFIPQNGAGRRLASSNAYR